MQNPITRFLDRFAKMTVAIFPQPFSLWVLYCMPNPFDKDITLSQHIECMGRELNIWFHTV